MCWGNTKRQVLSLLASLLSWLSSSFPLLRRGVYTFVGQRHGADGSVLVEMNGGFRALQVKEVNVSAVHSNKIVHGMWPRACHNASRFKTPVI